MGKETGVNLTVPQDEMTVRCEQFCQSAGGGVEPAERGPELVFCVIQVLGEKYLRMRSRGSTKT